MSSALIYKMRLTAPNKPGTASHNSNYVKYIAEREHVMKLSPESESGLFGRIDGTNNDELDVTDTQNYVYGISKAGVTVYNAYTVSYTHLHSCLKFRCRMNVRKNISEKIYVSLKMLCRI